MFKSSSNQIGESALEMPDTLYAALAKPVPQYSPLADNIDVDVCIVGAGFTGVSTALHLVQQGKRVAVVEANRVGWGASGRNGGHVSVGQRVPQGLLERRFGEARAQQLWRCGLDAVALLKSLIAEHAIDCDLKPGILHVAAKHAHVGEMLDDTRLLRNRYAYEQVRDVAKDELDTMLGSRSYFGAQLDMGSLTLNPLALLHGLTRAATHAGVHVYEHSRVTRFSESPEATVHTDGGTIRAKTIVLACNGYLDKLAPTLAKKIMPINNFILATEPLPEPLARELIRDDVGVQDSLFVVRYWRLSGDRRLVFGGGENYRNRFPADIAGFVRKNMLKVYPQLESVRIDYAWGGTLAITMNRMPHYGKLSDQVYFAQGYSGHGVPTAVFAGKLMASAILGDSREFELFSSLPSRTFPGGVLLRKPALLTGMTYYSLLDRF